MSAPHPRYNGLHPHHSGRIFLANFTQNTMAPIILKSARHIKNDGGPDTRKKYYVGKGNRYFPIALPSMFSTSHYGEQMKKRGQPRIDKIRFVDGVMCGFKREIAKFA